MKRAAARAAGRQPTMEEVARAAGVGIGTVSRVLNDSPQVSPRARAAVERAIAELGYVPNPAARSLVTGRTNSVAVVITEDYIDVFSEPFFARLLRGASDILTEADQQLVLAMVRDSEERKRLESYLRAGHVDGVLLVSLHGSDPLPEALHAIGMPVITGGRPLTAANVPYVDVDNRGGAHRAVAHLLSAGRRRVATIAASQDTSHGQDRLKGYRDALRAAGIRATKQLIIIGDLEHGGGDHAMQQLLEQTPDLDAVFVASDVLALGALRALRATGRRVPDDVAVLGFDDSSLAMHSDPPLSTVHQPVEEMGRTMARMLLSELTGGAAPEPVILPTELRLRQSG